MAAIFKKIPPGEGDESMSVKPWLGAIKCPAKWEKKEKKISKKVPKEDFGMEWCYGYRTEETRMNLYWNNQGQLVYPAAAVGIIYDYEKMTQKFFGGGKTKKAGRKQNDDSKNSHTDDVTSLALSDSRKLVATGQNGPTPTVFIWDAETCEVKRKLKLPKGCRLVSAIGISANDKYVAASDAAEKIQAHIF